MWDYRAKVIRVPDGDNVVAVLDQGFGNTKELDIRLLGVFAPELKDPGGPETRDFVLSWIARHSGKAGVVWPYVVTTAKTRTSSDVRSFSRYVGTLTNPDGTRNLNLDIIDFVRKNGYPLGVGGS